jgi:hypothetical protein
LKVYRGGFPVLGLDVGITALDHKKSVCYAMFKKALDLDRFLDKYPTRQNMDMRFGTRNGRSLYRVVSLMTVSWELSKYKLDLVGAHMVALNQQENTLFLRKGE